MDNIIRVLNKGMIELQDVFGGDETICQCAAVCYGKINKNMTDKTKRSMIKKMLLSTPKHNTPFESVVFRLHVIAPIFVARQWMRHRIGTFVEKSLRYTTAHSFRYFIPGIDSNTRIFISSVETEEPYVVISYRIVDDKKSDSKASVPTQSFFVSNLYSMDVDDIGRIKINYLGGTELPHPIQFVPKETIPYIQAMEAQFIAYESLLGNGVRKEIARGILGTSVYTEFIWTVNLWSFLNWVEKRFHLAAQKEHSVYARAAIKLVTPKVPITMSIFSADHYCKGMQEPE